MANQIRTAGRSLVSKLTGRAVAQTPGGKIGGQTKLGSRAVASVQAPTDKPGAGSNRSQAWTYFTKASNDTFVLYNGDRLWTKVVLTLETAGPVVVGSSQSLTPVLSGKGALLRTGVPTPFTIAKGTQLNVASTAINRIAVVIEPLPWLEQITATLMGILDRVGVATGTPDQAGGNRP